MEVKKLRSSLNIIHLCAKRRPERTPDAVSSLARLNHPSDTWPLPRRRGSLSSNLEYKSSFGQG